MVLPDEGGDVAAAVEGDFLVIEVDRLDRSCVLIKLVQPTPETQEAHTATIVAGVLQQDGAAGRVIVSRPQRPAGAGAEIKGENCTLCPASYCSEGRTRIRSGGCV